MEMILKIFAALEQTSLIEKFSVICSILQVLLSKNNRIENYFFGILGISTSMYILFESKLYADLSLHMYYLIMSVYGWWFWNQGGKQTPITFASKKEWTISLVICVAGFCLFHYFLTHFTNSDVPLWDAWVSSSAWGGMWLLARRKIENWILLNISNLFAIPLLFYKELYLFSALTLFLFVVAIFGYINWLKIIKKNQTHYA